MAKKKEEVEKAKTTKKKKIVEKEKMSIVPTLIIILAQIAACAFCLIQLRMLLKAEKIDFSWFESNFMVSLYFVSFNAIALLLMYWAYYKGKTRILEILELLIILYYVLMIPGQNLNNTIIPITIGITPLIMGLYYRIKLIKES